MMNMQNLKQLNPIEELTEQTVETLTEPIQPTCVALKAEQYNLLAKHISLTGQTIVKNTDLILGLPTQDVMKKLVESIALAQERRIVEVVQDQNKSTRSTVELESLKQSERLKDMIKQELNTLTQNLKARDLSPWKLKLKWAGIGAILPSMLCILLLILQR